MSNDLNLLLILLDIRNNTLTQIGLQINKDRLESFGLAVEDILYYYLEPENRTKIVSLLYEGYQDLVLVDLKVIEDIIVKK